MASAWGALQDQWSTLLGKLSYDYYLWRQDTASDLQLFVLAFVGLILTSSVLKGLAVQGRWPTDAVDFWAELYDVRSDGMGADRLNATVPREAHAFEVLMPVSRLSMPSINCHLIVLLICVRRVLGLSW